MAVRVVDCFEVVEVEHNAAQGMLVAHRERKSTASFVLEGAPRERPSEAIGCGKGAQFKFAHDETGEIREDLDVSRAEAAWLGICRT